MAPYNRIGQTTAVYSHLTILGSSCQSVLMTLLQELRSIATFFALSWLCLTNNFLSLITPRYLALSESWIFNSSGVTCYKIKSLCSLWIGTSSVLVRLIPSRKGLVPTTSSLVTVCIISTKLYSYHYRHIVSVCAHIIISRGKALDPRQSSTEEKKECLSTCYYAHE